MPIRSPASRREKQPWQSEVQPPAHLLNSGLPRSDDFLRNRCPVVFLWSFVMEELSLSGLEATALQYHAAVAGFRGVDPFCCRLDWLVPFREAFCPNRHLTIVREGENFLLLGQVHTPDGQYYYTSIENLWGFPSALIGKNSPRLLERLLANGRMPFADRAHVLLLGLPVDQRFLGQVADAAGSSHRLAMYPPTLRCVASLAGGVEGFLSRRSAKFRAALRRSRRQAAAAGIVFRYVSALTAPEVMNCWSTIVAPVERRSWKGRCCEGIDQDPMRTFYLGILGRISPGGLLRLVVAERDGTPVGYIFGACDSGRYRGLQFSFDQEFAQLSLGNVLQFRMIEWLCSQGCHTYDLGMVVDYKKRWAENLHATASLMLQAAAAGCRVHGLAGL